MAFLATNFGSPATVAGQFHAIDVDLLDFQRAAVALSQLAAHVDNLDLPLRAVKKIARDDMKERFESETSPDGAKWWDLDPDYAKRKEAEIGFEHPILTRERHLRDAATAEGAWSVSAESVWFDTSDLPEYWAVHQFGSEDFGAVFHATANVMGEADKQGEQNIPPRPFVGLSEEAENRVLDLFDIWFSEGLDQATKSYAVSSAGTLHERIRGRFGPRIIF